MHVQRRKKLSSENIALLSNVLWFMGSFIVGPLFCQYAEHV